MQGFPFFNLLICFQERINVLLSAAVVYFPGNSFLKKVRPVEFTAEQIEKVRLCTGASREEAKAALARCGGSVLDAVILLEQEGKAADGPTGYSTRERPPEPEPPGSAGWQKPDWREVRRALGDLARNCLSVSLEVWKEGRVTCGIPLLVALALCLVEPWVAAALFFLGLCFGYRVHVTGRGTEDWAGRVNQTMDRLGDTVSDAVSSILRERGKQRKR